MTEADRAKQIYDLFLTRASRDDEFRDWARYRADLTDLILRTTPRGGSLLILGAGRCNDLDLARLADHCGTMALSDYRPDTVEEAFRRYGLTPSDRLRSVEADYVGIPGEAYVEYTRLLLTLMQRLAGPSSGSLEEAAGLDLRALEQGLERIYRSNQGYEVDLGYREWDNAVVAGVHSQLNNSFRGLFQYVRKDVEEREGPVRLAEDLNAAIFAVTGRHTGDLVRRFNDAAFAAVRQGLVYGYEETMICPSEDGTGPVMGTVDGARQAGEAIRDLEAEERITCLWPLSARRGIRFEMSISYLPAREWRKKGNP